MKHDLTTAQGVFGYFAEHTEILRPVQQEFERFELEDITPSTVEEGYNRIEKKYGVKVGYIQKASENSWSIMIRTKEGKWVETVFCNSLQEGMYKTILVLYGYLVKDIKFKVKD